MTLKYLSFLFLFFSIQSLCQAQDTILIRKKTRDTVYIKKAPVVIRQTFVLEEENKPVIPEWMLDIYAGPNYFSSTRSSCGCPGYESFYDTLNKAYASSPGIQAGLNISRLYKHLLFTGSLGFTSYREKFIYSDTSGNSYNMTDRYNYLDFALLAGYKIGSGRISWIPAAGMQASALLSQKGTTINHADYSGQNLQEAKPYHSWNYQVLTRSRFAYNYSEKISFYIEPGYRFDIRPITRDYIPFIQRRNTFSASLGLSLLW
jgi:hypothetical protein